MTANPWTAGCELTGYYCANTDLLQDQRWDDLVLSALRGRVMHGIPHDWPILRWVDNDVEALPLVDAALFRHLKRRMPTCDAPRCDEPLSGRRNRLWVPVGQSVIEFQVCGGCRLLLDLSYTRDDKPLLAWR